MDFAPDWHKALPEEFHGMAKDAKSLPEVFSRMKGMRDEISARGTGLRVPGEASTDDEKAAFQRDLYHHLGVPDTPEAYDLKPPDGMEADAELIGLVAKLGPEIGLSKTAATKLADVYNQHMLARIEKIKADGVEARKLEHDGLTKDLGDKADGAVALAKGAAKRFGWPEESMDPTNEGFIGADAFKLVYGLAAELAKANGTDRTNGDGRNNSQVRDAAWAKRVQEGSEPESEHLKTGHPKFNETWAAIQAAYAVSFPGKR